MIDELDTTTEARDPQEIAIDELANGASIVSAAKAAGVTRRTIHNWKQDRDFQRRLNIETALRSGRLAAVINNLDEEMLVAVDAEIHRRLVEADLETLSRLRKGTAESINKRLPTMRVTEEHKTSSGGEQWKTAGAVLTSQSGVIDLEPVGLQPSNDDTEDGADE